MSSVDNTIQRLEDLRRQINSARNGDYKINRSIFNELKTLLIENGFDRDIITIDHNDKFFTSAKDYESAFGNPDEKFKDHQGKLASLCTKAIRDLKRVKDQQTKPKIIVKTEKVYPPTAWVLLRNTLFWTIIIGLFSIVSFAFYYLGQNSKAQENAQLVNDVSEKKMEIKELIKELDYTNNKLKKVEDEKTNLVKKLERIRKK